MCSYVWQQFIHQFIVWKFIRLHGAEEEKTNEEERNNKTEQMTTSLPGGTEEICMSGKEIQDEKEIKNLRNQSQNR